jgi:hypothetical protein
MLTGYVGLRPARNFLLARRDAADERRAAIGCGHRQHVAVDEFRVERRTGRLHRLTPRAIVEQPVRSGIPAISLGPTIIQCACWSVLFF